MPASFAGIIVLCVCHCPIYSKGYSNSGMTAIVIVFMIIIILKEI